MKRKKAPIARPRRDPYERALSDATTRLDKAVKENERCMTRIAELALEIPRLRRIIDALGPSRTVLASANAVKGVATFENVPAPNLRPVIPGVPPHLQKYMHPADDAAAAADTGDFLPETKGEEVLP